MVEHEEKETVVIHDRDDAPRNSSTGIWIGVAVIVIILLFLLFGGMNLFRGGGTTTTPSAPSAPVGGGTSTGQ
jgi:hypothetical protein